MVADADEAVLDDADIFAVFVAATGFDDGSDDEARLICLSLGLAACRARLFVGLVPVDWEPVQLLS